MVELLPAPEVVRCYFDTSFDPHLPAMALRWPAGDWPEHSWQLPEGLVINGPPPRQFGISVVRQEDDSYAVRLLWDRTCVSWLSLHRDQLLGSDLLPLLGSLGTDLWYLLDQPIDPDPTPPERAA